MFVSRTTRFIIFYNNLVTPREQLSTISFIYSGVSHPTKVIKGKNRVSYEKRDSPPSRRKWGSFFPDLSTIVIFVLRERKVWKVKG